MRSKTAAEKKHLSRVAALGCVAGSCGMPAEVHHPRDGKGIAQRGSHYDAIPLCPRHHRTGGLGVAIHAGQKTWEAIFGTEAELVEKTKGLLNAT